MFNKNKFFLGPLCKRGHDFEGAGKSLRYRSISKCRKCAAEQRALWFAKDPDRRLRNHEKYTARKLAENPEYIIKNLRPISIMAPPAERLRLRRAASAIRSRKYAKRNWEKVLAAKRARYDSDPSYRAELRLRALFNHAFSVFSDGGKVMPSKRYGVDFSEVAKSLGPPPGPRKEWEIDHIIPLCKFNFDDPIHVRAAFSPANHQWLPKSVNRKKSGSILTDLPDSVIPILELVK